MDDTIRSIHARELLDSRGNPTVEVEVRCDGGGFGRAIVPSGASTGKHEAVELRDREQRYGGRGVRRAVDHVITEIAPKVVGTPAHEQTFIDRTMIALDGTPQSASGQRLLGVSLAVANAAAGARPSLWRFRHRRRATCTADGRCQRQVARGATSTFRFPLPAAGHAVSRSGSKWRGRVSHARRRADSARLRGVLVSDEGGGPKLPENETPSK